MAEHSISDGNDWRKHDRTPQARQRLPSRNGKSVKMTRLANRTAAATLGCGDKIMMTSSMVGEGQNVSTRLRISLVSMSYNNAVANSRLTFVNTLKSGKVVCLVAMAAESHKANPTIVEPRASPESGIRPPTLTSSLNASSSSSSFESSRPQSRGSSATSPLEFSPSIPGTAYSHDHFDVSPPTPVHLEPPTSDTTPPTASVSSEPPRSSSYNNENAWLSLCRPSFTRRWLEQALGVFTLVASLVGLLFIGVRTYKLAVISTENSTLDGCVGLIQVSDLQDILCPVLTSSQAGFTTLENSTPLGKTAMENGPLSSPYHLGRRALHNTHVLASRWMKGPPKQRCGFPYISCQFREPNTMYRNMSTPAIVISTTLALGALTLIVARRSARSTEVFTSPARSDIQIISGQDSGPKIVAGQGIIESHNPEYHHELGQLRELIRERIRASQDQNSLVTANAPFHSTNSSSTTLVNGCSKSQVSLRSRSSGEHHKGLIELKLNGNTKAFFKIETGEFLRLRNWERQHSDISDSSSDSENPLSIEKDFAQTGSGASVLAKGKAVKDKWIEELQLEHEKWRGKHSHATQ